MTIEEKRELVADYCKETKCYECVLKCSGYWRIGGTGLNTCFDISKADEDELDRALELINDSTPATATEVIDCDHCKYADCDEETEPCASCKHNQTPNTLEYFNAPENYEPQDAVTTANTYREFSTGAKRDMGGKGRMDLLPWAAIMEVSKHCENGALKYGEHNVDKGIPTSSLCDSAARHLAKHIDGWTDEPHLLAAAWNLLWAIQMEIKHPELVDVPWREE